MERRMSMSALAVAAALGAMSGPARADHTATHLRGGAYSVATRLELPHLERWAIERVTTICVPDGADDLSLPILSGNNPFAQCAVVNVRRQGASLRYDIACPGRAAARASAAYELKPEAFAGRIAMVMGAKNMTMTEVQSGRRIGGCALAGASMSRRER